MDVHKSFQMELVVRDLTACVPRLTHSDHKVVNPMHLKQVNGLTTRLSSLLRMQISTDQVRLKL